MPLQHCHCVAGMCHVFGNAVGWRGSTAATGKPRSFLSCLGRFSAVLRTSVPTLRVAGAAKSGATNRSRTAADSVRTSRQGLHDRRSRPPLGAGRGTRKANPGPRQQLQHSHAPVSVHAGEISLHLFSSLSIHLFFNPSNFSSIHPSFILSTESRNLHLFSCPSIHLFSYLPVFHLPKQTSFYPCLHHSIHPSTFYPDFFDNDICVTLVIVYTLFHFLYLGPDA